MNDEDVIKMESFLQFEELRDTAAHINIIQAKLYRLEQAKRDSWEQLLTAAARMHRRGDLTSAQLLAFQRDMRASYGPGLAAVWNRNISIPLNKLRHVVAHEERIAEERNRTHWHGSWPVDGRDPVPSAGMPVVYVLLDGDGVPAYIGSTDFFRSRMKSHNRNHPGVFDRWVLYVCDDREAAYDLEVQLLRQKLPYLNKRAGR